MPPTGCESGNGRVEEDTATEVGASQRSSPSSSLSSSPSGSSSYLSVAAAVDYACLSDPGPFYGMFDRHDTDADHDWSNIRLSSPRPGQPRSSSSNSIVGASETFHRAMQQLDVCEEASEEAEAAAESCRKSSAVGSSDCCSKCGGVRSGTKPSASAAKYSSSSSSSSKDSTSSSKTGGASTRERKSSKPVQKSASFSTASSSTHASKDTSVPSPCCPYCCRAESAKRRMSVPACMRSSKHVQWADEAGVSSLVSVRLIRPRLAKGEEGQASRTQSPRSILRRLTGVAK